jgi:hypothetical protein
MAWRKIKRAASSWELAARALFIERLSNDARPR